MPKIWFDLVVDRANFCHMNGVFYYIVYNDATKIRVVNLVMLEITVFRQQQCSDFHWQFLFVAATKPRDSITIVKSQ